MNNWINEYINKTALSIAHTSGKAAGPAQFLLLNKHRMKHTFMWAKSYPAMLMSRGMTSDLNKDLGPKAKAKDLAPKANDLIPKATDPHQA